MLIGPWLADIAATQSAATAAAASQPTLADDITGGILIAWLVLSISAIVKMRVFAPKPLLMAPRRSAAALLPLAGAVMALYIFVFNIAILIVIATGVLPKEAIEAQTENRPAATTMASATTQGPETQLAPSTDLAASSPASAPAATEPGDSPQNDRNTMILQTIDVISRFIACGFGLVACFFLFPERLRGLGIAPRQFGWGILLGLLACLIVGPLILADNIVVSALYDYFHHEVSIHSTIDAMMTTQSFGVKMVLALAAGVGAPLTEEFFFRGLLQTSLIQSVWGIRFPADTRFQPTAARRWVAITITSCLFCAVHFENIDHFPILLLLAFSLGYVYERTGNLWASITLHAAFNWMSLIPILMNP